MQWPIISATNSPVRLGLDVSYLSSYPAIIRRCEDSSVRTATDVIRSQNVLLWPIYGYFSQIVASHYMGCRFAGQEKTL